MKTLGKLLATVIAAVALSGAASAATILNGGSLAIGDVGLGNAFTTTGTKSEFTYTATEDLRVLDFVSMQTVGFSGGSDIALITFGYDSVDIGNFSNVYTAIVPNGATTDASGTIGGFDLLSGQSFTLFFDYAAGGALGTSNQYSFATAALSAVPLPAGLLLLGTGLGAFGIAKRRKAKTAA